MINTWDNNLNEISDQNIFSTKDYFSYGLKKNK